MLPVYAIDNDEEFKNAISLALTALVYEKLTIEILVRGRDNATFCWSDNSPHEMIA